MTAHSHKHTHNQRKRSPNPLRIDPTRSATLRRKFQTDLRKRFKLLKKAIIDLVDTEDAFGIKPKKVSPFIDQGVPTSNQRFAAKRSDEQIKLFRAFVLGQFGSLVLDDDQEESDELFLRKFAEEGYKKGSARAFDDTRKPRTDENFDFFQGTKEEFLRQSVGSPVATERLRVLTSRVFTDLKGVGQAMSTQMGRVLADGLARGDGAKVIARELSKRMGVGLRRAETISRTEIVRAHAEGQLDSLERMGVTEVGVAVEWSTANDDRVCPLCRPMEGVVFTIKESRGLIPRHSSCRCAWIPANVGEDTTGQKRTKSQKQLAIDKSIKAEAPKGTSLEEQKKVSRSKLADTRAKDAPKSIFDDDKSKKSTVTKPEKVPKPTPKKAAPPKKVKEDKVKPKKKTTPKVKKAPTKKKEVPKKKAVKKDPIKKKVAPKKKAIPKKKPVKKPTPPKKKADIPKETKPVKDHAPTDTKKIEEQLKKEKTEVGVILDSKGNELARQRGTNDRIEFSREDEKLLKGNIMTHNHPDVEARNFKATIENLPLSGADGKLLADFNLSEIRSVGKEFTFSLKAKGDKPLDGKKINSEWRRRTNFHEKKETARIEKLVDEKKMTRPEANKHMFLFEQESQHQAWVDIADKQGLEYKKINNI